MVKTVDVKLTRTDARCPACDHALDQVPNVFGVVAGCFACGGVWLDNVAGRLFLVGPAPEAVHALLDALPSVAPRPVEARDGYRANARNHRRCPVCREPLAPQTLERYGVVVDLCEAHGTFFDARELLPVVRSLRRLSPALERELQAEADRLRDAATPLEVNLLEVRFPDNDPRRAR